MPKFFAFCLGNYSQGTVDYLRRPESEELDMDLAAQLVQHIHENQVIGRNNLHEFDTRDWPGAYEFYSCNKFLVRPLVCLRVQQVIFKLFYL